MLAIGSVIAAFVIGFLVFKGGEVMEALYVREIQAVNAKYEPYSIEYMQIYDDYLLGNVSDEAMTDSTEKHLQVLMREYEERRNIRAPERYEEIHDLVIEWTELRIHSFEEMLLYVRTKDPAHFERHLELMQQSKEKLEMSAVLAESVR